MADLRLFEVALADGGHSDHDRESEDMFVWKLRRAASTILELDARFADTVTQGKVAELAVRRSFSHPATRPRNATEAVALRPLVEDLIAPLLFESTSKPSLRPFQEYGVQWLLDRRARILADDMGLGKTAQALRALEELVETGTVRSAIVVCPKSLLANWEAECKRWVPGLTVVSVVPTKDEANEVWSAVLGRSHVIITSYEQLRLPARPLASARLELVIADEAHRLRRSQAKLVKSFRRLQTQRMWALTGTPIERHEADLATLMSLLEPTRFSARLGAIEFAELRAQARPYLLRRLKQDVLQELPAVIDTKEIIELSDRQQRAYGLVRSKPLARDAGDVLQRFGRLRSICDVDPDSDSSSKLDRIVEILQTVRDAKEKAVVFSYLLGPLEVLSKRLVGEDLGAVTLTGLSTTDERQRLLRRFKSDESIVVLLCSSRVGGEGLTLTEANHVIFVNEWWNPSANAQARDRVVRLGQDRVVHVHRFRCKGTIEECLEQILRRKREAFANVVDALVSGATLADSESNEVLSDEQLLGELTQPV